MRRPNNRIVLEQRSNIDQQCSDKQLSIPRNTKQRCIAFACIALATILFKWGRQDRSWKTEIQGRLRI